MQSEGQITTFFGARGEGGARRRRPGSRRSTSARTVYAGADLLAPTLAADLPWACEPRQWQPPSSLAGGAKRPLGFPAGGTPAASEPISALPGRRGSTSSAGDPKHFRDLSRFRGLSRLRLLASPTLPRPFATFRGPAPATSSRGAVTAVAGRGAPAAGQASPQGLTANAAHTPSKSEGVGVAIPADLIAAVEPSSAASAPGIANDVRATAAAPLSPADICTTAASHVLHLSLREEPTQPHLLTGKR